MNCISNFLWNIVFKQYKFTPVCANCREIESLNRNHICSSMCNGSKVDLVVIYENIENANVKNIVNKLESFHMNNNIGIIYIIITSKQKTSLIDLSTKDMNIKIIEYCELTRTQIPIKMCLHKIESLNENFIVLDSFHVDTFTFHINDYFTTNGIELLRQGNKIYTTDTDKIKEYLISKGLRPDEDICPSPVPYGQTKDTCRECYEFYIEYFIDNKQTQFDYAFARYQFSYITKKGILCA